MESICHGCMCILLYRKLLGVVVFHRSMLNWGVGLQWVSVHSSLCKT